MAEEKKYKKPGRFNGCIIAVLILIILAMIFTAVVYLIMQNKQKEAQATLEASMATVTTRIKEGALNVTIDNLTGSVRSNQSVDLYWQTSGTVQDVSVSVGDTVQKDDVLAYLDETTLDQDVLNASLDLQDAEDDLEALQDNKDDIAEKLSAMVTAQQTVEDAQDDVDSMDLTYLSDVNFVIARDTAATADLDYGGALDAFEELRYAPIDDATRVQKLAEIRVRRNDRDNAYADYYWYLGEIDELEIQKREAALSLANAKLEEAEYAYNKALQGSTDAQLASAQAKIDAQQKIIDSSKIIAPMSGTVTQVDAKVNDVVTYDSSSLARDVFAVRIDDTSAFYIDVTVSELYVNDLKKGQAAEITFAAIPDKTYHGEVYIVSDVGKTSGWNVTFAVTIVMTDADALIKSGMTADVSMYIDGVENALYVPQTAVLMEDDKYYVNKKNDSGDFDQVEVQIGVISVSNVQIISDQLKGDDEIELDVYGEEETESTFPFMMGMGGGGMGGGAPSGGGGGMGGSR